jgi:hypothetical protein
VLAIPLGIATNLLTPRVVSYLDKRRLIKTGKTRKQALLIYNRIRAFQEGRRDKYPYYILLSGTAALFGIASSMIVTVVLFSSPSFELTVLSLLVALILAMLAVASLAGIYETARQLERFDDYKREFEERWGPLNEDDLKG